MICPPGASFVHPRVIQPLPGKVIGIGPDRVEVSAEFVPGNSRSPIIHVKSGKVIGIATRDLQGSQAPTPASYRNSTVVRAVRDLETMLSRQRLSAPDRSRAFQSFVASIRATTQADITQARQALRYDYFTQSLRDEAEVREEMYKLFDRLLKSR